MQVFLSWSGPPSQKVAQLLSDWLPKVIQSMEPWISTRDIQKGSLWSEIIGDQLQGMTTGIICLTNENKERPWILFEAGALAKGLSSNRVCTLLIDLEPADIGPPLSQFNHTRPKVKEDMLHLLQTLNDRNGERKLRADILENALDVHWPEFETSLSNIIKETPDVKTTAHRGNDDIMREILDLSRSLANRVTQLEAKTTSINTIVSRKENKNLFHGTLNHALEIKEVGIDRVKCLEIIEAKYPGVHSSVIQTLINRIYN